MTYQAARGPCDCIICLVRSREQTRLTIPATASGGRVACVRPRHGTRAWAIQELDEGRDVLDYEGSAWLEWWVANPVHIRLKIQRIEYADGWGSAPSNEPGGLDWTTAQQVRFTTNGLAVFLPRPTVASVAPPLHETKRAIPWYLDDPSLSPVNGLSESEYHETTGRSIPDPLDPVVEGDPETWLSW